MADVSLQAHKSLIINLFNNENLREDKIVKRLRSIGVEATTFDIYNHLEKWHIIPSPSPVLSLEPDDTPERGSGAHADRLSVECHHGTHFSHTSHVNLTNIPSDSTALEKFERDYQAHESRAFQLRYKPPYEEPNDVRPLEVDGDDDRAATLELTKLRYGLEKAESKSKVSKRKWISIKERKRRKVDSPGSSSTPRGDSSQRSDPVARERAAG